MEKIIHLLLLAFLLVSCNQKEFNFGCETNYINSNEDIGKFITDSIIYFDINFVYLGKPLSESEKDLYSIKFFNQLESLNNRFKKYNLLFRAYDNLVYFNSDGHYTISEVRDMYFNDDTKLESLLSSLEIDGAINVFSFDFSEQSSISGYTPTLRSGFEFYKIASPRYDRIIVSDYGMLNARTMIHELVHFFHASDDIVDMNQEQRERLGITASNLCDNEMNYSCCASQMTVEQIENFIVNAFEIRGYLAKTN